MKILSTATVTHLRTLNADQLMNFWYSAWYHPSRYAVGKGSKRYAREIACFASNLSTYLLCGQEMYKDIAERCAARAEKLRQEFQETKQC